MVLGKMGRIPAALAMLALAISISVPVQARVVGATLSGTVTDSTGAFVAKVKVTITDVATGVAHTVDTNSAGLYTAPNLLPLAMTSALQLPASRHMSARASP
jgi:hypothetical protein